MSFERQAVPSSSVVSVVIHPPPGSEVTKATTTITVEDKENKEHQENNTSTTKEEDNDVSQKQVSQNLDTNLDKNRSDDRPLPLSSPSLSFSDFGQSYSAGDHGSKINHQQHDSKKGNVSNCHKSLNGVLHRKLIAKYYCSLHEPRHLLQIRQSKSK